MKKLQRIAILFSVLLLVLAGCTPGIKGNPTPKDVLKTADADIFLLDGIVYTNVQDTDWVQELDYTLGEQVAEITKQSGKAWNFKNGTSNKLPVGTTIYETGTPVYIAVVEGEEIPYLGMYEG